MQRVQAILLQIYALASKFNYIYAIEYNIARRGRGYFYQLPIFIYITYHILRTHFSRDFLQIELTYK